MFAFVFLDCVYFFLLFVASMTDFKKRIIPNKISFLMLNIAIFKIILQWNFSKAYIFSVLGGFFLPLIFIGIPFFINNSMGAGDLKLSAFSGLFLGFRLSIITLCASFFSCALFAIFTGIYNFALKKPKTKTLPFAPFLLLGSLYAIISKYFF
ncbi:MAG: prepilin peptidase [Clostridia bacterium]|nr:prepilin peptidase [Clostridia bacterium]